MWKKISNKEFSEPDQQTMNSTIEKFSHPQNINKFSAVNYN